MGDDKIRDYKYQKLDYVIEFNAGLKSIGKKVEDENNIPNGTYLRIRIAYDWSELQKRQTMDDEWVIYMRQDLNEYGWLNDYMEKFEQPFQNLAAISAERGEEEIVEFKNGLRIRNQYEGDENYMDLEDKKDREDENNDKFAKEEA